MTEAPSPTSAHPTDVATTTIGSRGTILECSLVPWDTAAFGFPVAEISRAEIEPGTIPDEVAFEAFDRWCTERDVRFVSARLDHLRLVESMALEAHGFRFVEMVFRPHRDDPGLVEAPRHSIAVAAATAADLPVIEAVAFEAFRTGQFVLDERLPPELGRRRYARWVRSAFDGSVQSVLKAELDGELVGFFIVEARPDGLAYWHLTAISPARQGMGIGLSLWQTMLRRHAAEGATSIETTISVHNLAAVNLYARLGFTFSSAQMTFHRLVIR